MCGANLMGSDFCNHASTLWALDAWSQARIACTCREARQASLQVLAEENNFVARFGRLLTRSRPFVGFGSTASRVLRSIKEDGDHVRSVRPAKINYRATAACVGDPPKLVTWTSDGCFAGHDLNGQVQWRIVLAYITAPRTAIYEDYMFICDASGGDVQLLDVQTGTIRSTLPQKIPQSPYSMMNLRSFTVVTDIRHRSAFLVAKGSWGRFLIWDARTLCLLDSTDIGKAMDFTIAVQPPPTCGVVVVRLQPCGVIDAWNVESRPRWASLNCSFQCANVGEVPLQVHAFNCKASAKKPNDWSFFVLVTFSETQSKVFRICSWRQPELLYQVEDMGAVWKVRTVGTDSRLVLVTTDATKNDDDRPVPQTCLECWQFDDDRPVVVGELLLPISGFELDLHLLSHELLVVSRSNPVPLGYTWNSNEVLVKLSKYDAFSLPNLSPRGGYVGSSMVRPSDPLVILRGPEFRIHGVD